MMSYRKAQWLFQILWMCYVITFGPSVNILFLTFFFLSFCFSLCLKHTHTHTLTQPEEAVLEAILCVAGFCCHELVTANSLSTLRIFLSLNISPKLLLNRFPLLCWSLYRAAYFYTFLHELPPPLHRPRWCCAHQQLSCFGAFWLKTGTLALCSPQPGLWNLG